MKHLLIIITVLFFSCGKSTEELPAENYDKLFPTKNPDKVVISYEDMNILPCDPMENEKEFKNKGVTIKENVRTYTVSLEIYFNENHRGGGLEGVFSKLDVRYIDEQGKLKVAKTYEDNGVRPTLQKGKKLKKEFKVKSGYPLYLAVFGAGFDYFNTRISLKAVSDDGVITAPELHYQEKTTVDGYKELSPYCQKIILP